MLEHTLSEEEHSQIVQTIEMFEVITQTQPDDYQSLEILKDAYTKIARPDEALRISRKLAEAYFNGGSYTLAMQECENLLLLVPNSPEILAMQGDIETRLQNAGEPIVNGTPLNGARTGLVAVPHMDFSGEIIATEGGLTELNARSNGSVELQERGDDQLAKFLIMQQLVPEETAVSALETVKELNKNLRGQALATSLLEKVSPEQNDLLERIMSQLIDRTKSAYVPLEYYDVDRQVARMLPDHLTLGRLFLPFDLISRTIMIACCNPFDIAGREVVQQSLDYTVAWYLARPSAIVKCLQDIYRLESRA